MCSPDWGESVSDVQEKLNPGEVITAYISAMDNRDYDAAKAYLADNILVKGPAGEAFRSPAAFLNMMREQQGKYDVKKMFVDGNDVCLLYDFIASNVRVLFCSWYQVKNGKIFSIQTIFDTAAFASPDK